MQYMHSLWDAYINLQEIQKHGYKQILTTYHLDNDYQLYLNVCYAIGQISQISVLFFFFFFFRDRVSLCIPGCPGTHFVDQAGLELRNLPAPASRVLGLKACATTPGSVFFNKQFNCCLNKEIDVLSDF
jgi:hypothetical protein